MIIGMDFGTTNSGIAVYDGERLQFVPIDPANRNASIARTALYLTNDRQVYIGRDAIDTYFAQNLNRAVSIERVRVGEITLTFAELPTFVRDVYIDKDVLSPGRLFVSFKTALASLNYLGTVVGAHFYFLEDIIALYLYIAKQRAEAFLGTELKRIVLGRPVHFAFKPEDDALAAERLLKAAFRAGYEQVYLQYEPVAAAYQYESTIDHEQNALIFDFGGGTLDISVMRVGNPKTRKVLANGGVPIAGDIFDQKLARARLPQHFGEDSFYRSVGKRLPVPSAFYEAFANWQELLALQRPETLEDIMLIEKTAERPHQIRALRSLISSSYSLKMYDIVENAKRQLSQKTRAEIELEGEGFNVYEPVHRADFESVIRSEYTTIETYLDALLNDAGLKPDDIDVVIRTGGSSQIPVFVKLLETRFGAEKVRSIDAFSSVTAGLGIIAHQLEQDEMDARVYRSEDYPGHNDLGETGNSIPAVDFDVMKKFIALHAPADEDRNAMGIVALDPKGKVRAALPKPDSLNGDSKTPFDDKGLATAISLPADTRVLLCTSEYRFLLKTPRDLTRLQELGLILEDAEGFQRDVFGDEHITGVARYDILKAVEMALLVTAYGAFKVYRCDELLPRLDQIAMYRMPRLKGDPLTLIPLHPNGEVVAFSAAGRATRVRASALTNGGRLMRTDSDDYLIAAFGISGRADFLLGADNSVTQINSADISLTELNAQGAKVRRSLQSVVPASSTIFALTTQRILSVSGAGTVQLNKDERLISLLAPTL